MLGSHFAELLHWLGLTRVHARFQYILIEGIALQQTFVTHCMVVSNITLVLGLSPPEHLLSLVFPHALNTAEPFLSEEDKELVIVICDLFLFRYGPFAVNCVFIIIKNNVIYILELGIDLIALQF